MLRISKMTDYAFVILAFLTKEPTKYYQANEIASQTKVSKPTVSKVLKTLAKHGLVDSYRGVYGGYKMNKVPSQISVAEIIQVLEGPMAIMACTLGMDQCAISSNCQIQAPWHKINHMVFSTLDAVKLSDLYQS